MPLKWIPLEDELIKQRKMGKNILSFQTIKEINDESHCLIADEGELKLFLKFHHDLGTVIYFDDVPDFIIINPNWFVKALRCIVSARDFISENLQLNWKDYEETGCIGIKMIQTIFQQKDPELEHNQEHIMHLLEKYDIVVEMPNDVRQKENKKQYCVPCIVQASAIESITNNFVGQETTSFLCFEYEFLPPVFFCHLVVYLLRTYKLSNESPSSSKKALYRGACVFDIDTTGSEKLFICKYQNTIQVQIWRWNTAITGSSGQRIRIDIEDHLTFIQRKYKLDSLKNYKLKVKCQFSESTSLEGMVELDSLVSTESKFYCNVHGYTHSTENIRRTWAFNRGEDKISKLTDENMNFLRIQKISTELMCDILYELLLHDNYVGLKPRNESDISDLYSKIRGQNLRVPSNGWGGQRLPNESIQTNTGDDVERIRLIRNRLQHSSQFQMSDSEYNERIQQLTRLTERGTEICCMAAWSTAKFIKEKKFLAAQMDMEDRTWSFGHYVTTRTFNIFLAY
ncbi:serine pats1 threonine-protein kinase, partial [Mytilus galloprovincialis]